MTQLKPVTTGGLLRDVNDNFNALSTVGAFAGLHQRRTAIMVFEVDETLDGRPGRRCVRAGRQAASTTPSSWAAWWMW
jgi:hypothetical protein